VDVFGLPADWEHLRRIADKHGLRLIDDSCEALGASRKLDDRGWAMAGSFGDAGTFAFYPNKQITTGEGGMIVTDDADVAELCRSMRNQGRDSGAEWLRHARLGYNYRLSDINCALGIAQMSRLDQILAARRRVAGWYEEMLRDIDGVVAPAETPDTRRSWFVYVVRLARCQSRQDLNEVVRRLRGRGIGCSNYFYPIHLQPFYREMFGYEEGDFPVTESISRQTLALPFHNRLSRQSVDRVVDALRTTLDELGLGA
jgi:perosamine synthetase